MIFRSYLPYQATLRLRQRAGLFCTLREASKRYCKYEETSRQKVNDVYANPAQHESEPGKLNWVQLTFVALMPNTEHALVLPFAHTIETKRDVDYRRRLHFVVQEDDRMFLSIAESFLHASKWLYGKVRILPHVQLDLGTVYPSSQSPRARFLRSLSEDLDRPVIPFVCGRISWRCVTSACAYWLIANVSHTLAAG